MALVYVYSTAANCVMQVQAVHNHLGEALVALSLAAELSGNELMRSEAVACRALLCSVQAALLWCAAPERAAAGAAAFAPVRAQAIALAEQMRELRRTDPWVWTNNCWHQDRTPLSQRGLYVEQRQPNDCFTAAIQAMQAEVASTR